VDEATNTIKEHINTERQQLGRNLDEMEYRIKDATDIRNYYDKNTALFLGAAVAGGFLLSKILRNTPAATVGIAAAASAARRPSPLSKMSGTIDNIFDGLVDVVSEKLETFVADAVPGFRQQYVMDRQRNR